MHTKNLTLLFAALWLAAPAYAQKGKELVKAVGRSGKIEQNVLRGVQSAQPNYDAVFGYIAPLLPKDLATVYPVTFSKIHQLAFIKNERLIQTAPILNPAQEPLMYLSAFTHPRNLGVTQLAEGFYLYRLAHPTWNSGGVYLSDLLTKATVFLNKQPENILQIKDLPAVQFLARLGQTSFIPNTYAELALLYPQYPKHVTLTEEGLPVPTAHADMARLLDTYLMLSNRKELGAFNNTAQGANYTPFILTPEEHAAANELLKFRLQNEQIPANPTPRDLIELAYNRLESHTVPYTQLQAVNQEGYQAYPNYKNTSLHNTIQGMINGKEPIVQVTVKPEHPWQLPTQKTRYLDKDLSHLIVLNAVMGGVEPTDFTAVSQALHAFNALCITLEKTPESIAHVRVLQQNLRRVFQPLIVHARTSPYNSLEAEDLWGWQAYELLEKYAAEDLVGYTPQQRQ